MIQLIGAARVFHDRLGRIQSAYSAICNPESIRTSSAHETHCLRMAYELKRNAATVNAVEIMSGLAIFGARCAAEPKA